MNAIQRAAAPLPSQPKDYASDQEVRWCPGCGDYAILRAVHKVLAERAVSRANTVFVSGIGCSSRFPYYMSTYGFHTIHGRAPAFATGIKLANPGLDVWIVTGDGDGLSIGGNHLAHLLRRDLDVQLLLFNNEIYGLTKGQASPTSRIGTISATSPFGSVDRPMAPAVFALGAGARFVARGVDRMQTHLPEVLAAAHDHRGASFVEILQNCLVYNDAVFDGLIDKDTGADSRIEVRHGQPLRFGRDGRRGLRLRPGSLALEMVGADDAGLLVHDETSRALALLLAEMTAPFPTALGVLYRDPAAPAAPVAAGGPPADLNALMRQGATWRVG